MAIGQTDIARSEYLDKAIRAATDITPFRDCDIISFTRVGVVGAGTMGKGIALNAVLSGYHVSLYDKNLQVLDSANLWITERVRRAQKMTENQAKVVSPGEFSSVRLIEELSDCDLIIEAIPEILEAKRAMFRLLDGICRPGAILASNTSTLDIDLIAAATQRPHNVIGMHFFSPAHVMRLLEIVPTQFTDRKVLASVVHLSQRLGKIGVRVGRCYGFAGNRMIEGFGREANLLVLEGNSPEDIDAALKDFGFAMGAMEVADLVGIDVPYAARQQNPNKSQDPSYYRIADVLVAEGALGQKSGLGYYEYLPDGERRLNPRILELAATEAKRLNVRQKASSYQEIVDRCVFPMINEGARIFEERIVERTSDLDVIMTLGYGFPSSTGGPMKYADTRGLPVVLECIERLQIEYGFSWSPAALLRDSVRNQTSLSDLSAVSSPI